MNESLIRYNKRDGVATLELCNPPANAYSYPMFRQLDEAILDARMDDAIFVIVIAAAGDKFFCAGADISMLQRMSPSEKYSFCLHANETLLRLERTPKLVIAAISGHCVGGGLEVALAADLRFAKAGEYKLGLPEVHLGVLPGTGGTQRLTRLVGASRAFRLMIDGKTMAPARAKELGLIDGILDCEDFKTGIQELATSYAPPGRAPLAIGHIKRAVLSGGELPLESGLALERELQQRLFTSTDAGEGLRAFAERRKPSFSGD